MGHSPKWQQNYTDPFLIVDILSAVNVTIQKSKKLVVHIDKLKPFVGDAPAAWLVGISLDAAGGSLTESQTPSDFTRASIPAGPVGTDIEFEHEMGYIPSSVGNPFMPSSGCRGSCKRGACQGTSLKERRPFRMRRPHAHLREYHCRRITLTNCSVKVSSRMAEPPVIDKHPIFCCFLCDRELKRAYSLRRHLLKQLLTVPRQKGKEYTRRFGLTAEQWRHLSADNFEDAAVLAERHRAFQLAPAEKARPAKKKKPSTSSSQFKGDLSGAVVDRDLSDVSVLRIHVARMVITDAGGTDVDIVRPPPLLAEA